jgi:hypothetical protein
LKFAPEDTFTITAATPITIPNTVRVERSFALLCFQTWSFPALKRGIINGALFYRFYRKGWGQRKIINANEIYFFLNFFK